MQKRIKVYKGVVSDSTFLYDFPADNKQTMIDVLTRRGQMQGLVFVDPEEEERMKQQAEAIKAKFSRNIDEPVLDFSVTHQEATAAPKPIKKANPSKPQ